MRLTQGVPPRIGVATDVYTAPEVFEIDQSLNGTFSTAADIWSLGAITYCIQTGSPAFSSVHDIVKYMTGEMDFPVAPLMTSSAGFLLFIQALMAKLPTDRVSISKALDHPWLKSLGEIAAPASP